MPSPSMYQMTLHDSCTFGKFMAVMSSFSVVGLKYGSVLNWTHHLHAVSFLIFQCSGASRRV